MLGGGFLCFEGAEKLVHSLGGGSGNKKHGEKLHAIADPQVDLVVLEKEKIKGAIRTDFVLSAEIVVIALGTVQAESFLMRSLVLVVVAAGVTVGVYALVAAIVKMDDVGLAWSQITREGALASSQRAAGRGILWSAPRLMRILSVLGTTAMFLVGGGILVHGLPVVSRWVHGAEHAAEQIPSWGGVLGALTPTLIGGLLGLLTGGLLVLGTTMARRWVRP
jgi:predicted DNA repair protein MutK